MKKILVSLFLLVTLFSCSSIFKKNDDVSTKVSKEDMKQQKIEDKKQKDEWITEFLTIRKNIF